MSSDKFSPRSARGKSDGERFPLPPALARLPDSRRRLPREFVEQNQRNRILLAALAVFGENGYSASTVQDLIVEASVSRATFYKYFRDKEECLRAVHDEVLGWLGEQARDAGRPATSWAAAVVAICGRLLALFAEDPRLARLCTVESLLGGEEVRARHEAALAELAVALRRGRSERPWGEELPSLLEPLLVAGAVSLAGRTIAFSPDPDVSGLAETLPESILLPYLGAEDARGIARGSS